VIVICGFRMFQFVEDDILLLIYQASVRAFLVEDLLALPIYGVGMPAPEPWFPLPRVPVELFDEFPGYGSSSLGLRRVVLRK